MNRAIIYTSITCLSIISSCKKDKGIDTPAKGKTTKELLIGEWIINHTAKDENGNGIMNDNEIDIRTDYHFIFEESGNSAKVYSSGTDNSNYVLNGNDITINPNGAYPKTLHIEAISATELRYWYEETDMTTVVKKWDMFDRK